ncbi:tRNA-i(6)A37 thiotransferase enzyme MiaB [Desulfotomaculum arcticum]|uniref:tRNA-2-methylthio-N(6)-dimethylallyladenosine synthase n=1 Tax=Desulfotruncus arcticus DSM 17038 TaxID=1121424 RepID=A0A1I2S9M0_9FIRM|nr:tRNA (N6-isopentenyl adenosine(37)-C2)-methylthiotransferase MiaB [Desulfotruncus arcticus]SFG46651.1 tRNA-i(6)A37 thiotransferase enzyme MiaB [Desulfotomaculum arcticum] [Desulfotruncus arcticus DSM 17038]
MSTEKIKNKKYLIITFGCQMNEHDSERIAGILENNGYNPVQDINEADLIIINTCCVRETAENKVYGLLGRLGKIKKNKPDLIIGVGGCMSQQEHVGKRLKQRFPYVDVVFGTFNLHTLGDLLTRARETKQQVIDVWQEAGMEECDFTVKRVPGVRAWVNIMLGCNNFCTYCIVPYVRGRERSRSQETIINEITKLGQEGYKDITLLGQNVNSFGKDIKGGIDFADLLTRVNSIDSVDRIRYMTSHPRDFNDKLIVTIAGLSKVCEHIHLPVQAGSNKILKKMNRGYSREDYFNLVARIRAAIPDVSLTTDVMVGFPGETDADFRDTFELMQEIKFDSAFTFVYNKREGTPAAKMEEQIPDEVKSKRIQEIIQLQNQISLGKNKLDVGKVLECLVEGPSKTNSELLSARTRTNKIVVFKGEKDVIGKILPLKITGYSLTHLEGEGNAL